jgi:Kdo2-lipid IVA lauroyltransferase/acyltransferase
MSDRLGLRLGYAACSGSARGSCTAPARAAPARGAREPATLVPGWSPAELRAVEREFVRRQGEAAAEVLYSSRIGADELRERVTLANPAVLATAGLPAPADPRRRPSLQCGVDAAAGLAGARRALVACTSRCAIPARRWLRNLRSRFGARLVAAKSVLQELARMRDVGAIGLLADQVPRTSPEKHWLEFLGQDTAFYMGPNCSAVRCGRRSAWCGCGASRAAAMN